MKQRLTTLTILFLLTFNGLAQDGKIDSLERLLQQNISDTTRVGILDELSSLYVHQNLDTSYWYAKQLLEFGQQLNDDEVIIIAQRGMSEVYVWQNYGIDTVIAPLNEALKLANKAQLVEQQVYLKNDIGAAYRKFGQLEKALSLFQEALQIAEKENLKAPTIPALMHIALLASHRDDNEKAKTYYLRALKYTKETNNLNEYSAIYNDLSVVYFNEQQLDSSLYYLNEFLEFRERQNSNSGVVLVMSNMGDVYAELGDYEKANFYLEKAYDLAKQTDNTYELTVNLYYRSGLASEEGKYQDAIKYSEELLSLLDDNTDTRLKIACYRQLSESYSSAGQYQNALKYTNLYHTLNDSIFGIEKEQQIKDLEIKYDVAKKDAANELLKAKNENAQKTARNRTIAIVALVLALLFAAGFGVLFYQSNQRRKELNEALEQRVKERTDELLTANQELNEIRTIQLLEEAKSRFFANVSHEFRTPLTLIQAPIEYVLQSNELSNKNYTMLSKAMKNSQQLKHLVGQVLDLTKLEANKLELNETKTLFYPLVRRLVANFETYAQQKQISLRFDYQMNQNIQLELDTDKFEKILNNYLSNAVKFTPKQGKIIVTTKDLGDRIQLSVSDTGQGIPKSELSKIFERYYQAKNSLKGVSSDKNYTGGTGIGLSLCADYAELFNGKAWAESPNNLNGEQEKGSTFYFEFPKKEFFAALTSNEKQIIEARTSVITPLPISIENNTNGSASILIVEDNYDLSSFLSAFLTSDYSIIVKENGQQALDWLAATEQLPSLILSDIMMPKVDGFELLETLKNNGNYRHIPMMMLTARADVKDKLKALRIGVDDYMLKPFNATELKVRVKNIIDNYNNRITTIQTATTNEAPIEEQLKISEKDNLWLQQLETEIDTHAGNLSLTADFIASKMYISRARLFQQVKKLTGMTFNQYLNEIRLQKAKTLLETGKAATTKEIAYSIGFKDAGYFSKLYSKRFGKRPSEYF